MFKQAKCPGPSGFNTHNNDDHHIKYKSINTHIRQGQKVILSH